MPFYAWTQDLPIDLGAYQEITDRLADSPMPGLVVHLAIEHEDGHLRYVEVWESEQLCDAAFESVIHPAVHPVLMHRQVRVDGEPQRVPINVVDVRFGDGSSVRPA